MGLCDRIALHAQIIRLAETDALTGVGTRRAPEKSLERIWAECRRSGEPVSMLFVDADSFKDYDETHGDEAGDAAIRLIARCIASQMRTAVDVVARYGREEFVVIFA